MKQIIFSLLVIVMFIKCNFKEHQKTNSSKNVKTVATFKGQQVTGVSVSSEGRIFANFPRWHKKIENSVVEINNGKPSAYPNKQWNSWNANTKKLDSVFVAVQSVISFKNDLYVLDTRNPFFQGVISAPRIFNFDLKTNQLKNIYILSENSYHKNSYINDLRVDQKNEKIYLTDSGHGGLIIFDLKTKSFKRILNNHFSTSAEQNFLTFKNGKWNNTVHSDGIALDTKNNLLYYHALTGYSLYAIPTEILTNGSEEEIKQSVQLVAKTAAPDGMIFDEKGFLYLADLENDKIIKFNPKTNKQEVFLEGKHVKWADTFSIYNNELFYTNSKINEAGNDISKMVFDIKKIKLE